MEEDNIFKYKTLNTIYPHKRREVKRTIMSIEQHSQETKDRIKKAIKETRKRRSTMHCATYIVKVDPTFLKKNPTLDEKITRLFLEAKWFKNHVLSHNLIFSDKPHSLKKAEVVMKDKSIETRDLKTLGSHMKQSIVSSMKDDIKGLSVLKKNGHKVGRLKPCKEVSSIGLKEHGNTYRVDVKNNRVHVQKVGWLRVNGLKQLPETVDFSTACLVHKSDGYYIHITAYSAKDTERVFVKDAYVGIDMGLKTSITLSDGEKFDFYVEEPDRLKKLRRKLSRQHKGSNNYVKTLNEIKKIEQHLTNKKKDMAYKLVSDLSHFEHVFFQDEMISSWRRKTCYVKGGKKIQYGILGRVKSLLKEKDWATMIGKHHATTQTCVCGAKNKHQLDERIYFCSHCGYSDDRDIHAAKNMVRFATHDVRYKIDSPQGLGIAPVEETTSAIHFNVIDIDQNSKWFLMKQETNSPSVSW